MSKEVTHYRVFIASPGGLEAERRAFHGALNKHNEADAIARYCFFEPIGWEITLGGVGRPQAKINKDLATCDYFVLVLANRWGSPSGPEGSTSGTNEEYMFSRKLLASKSSAMREVVVFFKGLEPALLSDPGPQLSKVIEFKRHLEDSKELLFESFDTVDAFADRLKAHLAEWTRSHEHRTRGGHDSRSKPEPDAVYEYEANGAEEAIPPGHIDLERQLAFDVTNIRSMQSFEKYGSFLMREQRFADAERVFREMFELASSANDERWSSTALARIAGSYRSQGKTREALDALKTALATKGGVGDRVGESFVHGYLGDIYTGLEKPEDALSHYSNALKINPDVPPLLSSTGL